AMVKLGILNSRMKDFYDIWLLSRLYDFDGKTLTQAIRMTFERRGTKLSPKIEAFTESFMVAKQTQWNAFWKRLQQQHVPASFKEIAIMVNNFISPITSDLFSENSNQKKWSAPGPWIEANKSNPEE
ncbi:MAG: nucleotidyl transferase AbiEii/AbiGii toxin family protein, partial [Deltaproteobacteria bacterium]|nr:nucleotidyl transferase AbiEii/AbiGii toxin family protein [Deltaproteobacteria bacterium]